MAKLVEGRGAQRISVLTFSWNFNDTMEDTSGVVRTLGADATNDVIGADCVFGALALPLGAIMPMAGSITTTTAFDAATYTVKIGTEADDDKYLAATDIKAAAAVAIPAIAAASDGSDIIITINAADACTTGAATIILPFIISGRVDEVTA